MAGKISSRVSPSVANIRQHSALGGVQHVVPNYYLSYRQLYVPSTQRLRDQPDVLVKQRRTRTVTRHNMLQEAPLLNASPLLLLEAPPRRRCCPPKYSCCCVVLTVLAALLVGAAAGGGLVATVLMQLAAKPSSPDLPPASSCCAPTAGGLTGRFVGNVSATKTVLWS